MGQSAKQLNSINEELDAGSFLPRHLHEKPYATLILEGSYIEAGDHGRFKVSPGDILMHGHFSSHTNWVAPNKDVKTVNIELDDAPEMPPVCTSSSFDEVVRFSNYDVVLAANELFISIEPKAEQLSDWPEVLAKSIRSDPEKSIDHWCKVFELAPATVSRGFKRSFGMTVVQYRAAVRTRGAFLGLRHDQVRLSELALRWGFADQAHLSRSVRSLTGKPPSYWQKPMGERSKIFKTIA